MSIVRNNLLTRLAYTPYCGRDAKCPGTWPRTRFDGEQFKCPSCGWKSSFDIEFIDKYKEAQAVLRKAPEPKAGGVR